MSTFDDDKRSLTTALDGARKQLLDVIDHLTEDDLTRGRRGSWTVARILQHVIDSERIYVQVLHGLIAAPAPDLPHAGLPATTADARSALDATRTAVLNAVEIAPEDGFYDLRRMGHEEYSVFSVLENVANHDIEHAHQISATLTAVE